MAGYNHHQGMSNNDVAAYDRGAKPLSQITLEDLREAGWTGTKKLAVELAKADVWPCYEWHHSGGTWYNEVRFYEPIHLVEMYDVDDLGNWKLQDFLKAAAKATKPAASDPIRVKGTFAVWGGSRRKPRHIGDEAFTGELKAGWIHLDGGGKKKAAGNHISYELV